MLSTRYFSVHFSKSIFMVGVHTSLCAPFKNPLGKGGMMLTLYPFSELALALVFTLGPTLRMHTFVDRMLLLIPLCIL